MKTTFRFSLVLMGFTFTVTQALMIRELLVSYSGNEISIGLILGSWLLLEALGSGVISRLFDRWEGGVLPYATLQAVLSVVLPLCLFLVYSSRTIAGVVPGEGLGLGAIFLITTFVILPVALIDGVMFAVGARAYDRLTGEGTPSVGWTYGLEGIGAMVGGILFTFLLIPYLLSLQIVLVLSSINLLSAFVLTVRVAREARRRAELRPMTRIRSWGTLLLVPLLLVAGALLVTRAGADLQRWGSSLRWKGFEMAFSRQSIYGEVTVLEIHEQYTFYADGLPIFTSPVPDIVTSEELVHLTMLYTPEARSALVLSGGLGGVINELAKYPFTRVDYAELDPLLIQAVERFSSPLTEGELSDPRVSIENVDGRWLVRRMVQEEREGAEYEYDLVVVNLPPPTTLQLNRFYTAEAFQMIDSLMAESGVLVLKTPGTLSYMNEELRALNRSIQQTLQSVFPYVLPIPDETTLWLASRSDALDMLSLEDLIERWDRRGLEAQLITAPHIGLKLDELHRTWFENELSSITDDGRAVEINSDLHPVGVMHGIAHWSSIFSPGIARLLQPLQRLSFWSLALPFLGLGGLALIALRRNETKGQIILPVVVGSTGFAGMTADLLVILAFQSLYGFVYQWVGLLIAAFMAGLGLGGLWMTRRLGTLEDKRRNLVRIEIALVAFWILLPGGLALVYSSLQSAASVAALQWALLLLNALAGFLVGAQFPLSNSMWIRERTLLRRKAGVLYAFDLVGAFLAAILVAVVFMPILGLVETCLLAAGIKAISLLLSLQLPATAQPT